jgi:glycosyltransferase involved in cell wall biosynthesis
VCNAHPADDARVFHRTCVGLADAGYEVHLFAVSPKEDVYCDRNVFIHPLKECESRRERFARRSRVARMAADLNPDLFHVHEPELLGSVIAVSDSRPVIYDVHESYLDIIEERSWIPQLMKSFFKLGWDWWERKLVRHCAGVVVVTESIGRRYYGLHKKVKIVPNYPDLVGIDNVQRLDQDRLTCVFVGVLAHYSGLPQIFEALAVLKKRGLTVPLALAGWPESNKYLPSLWDAADRLGVRDLVTYHGALSKREAILFQCKGSIALVLYQPIPNCVAGLPNKLVESMALGLPVVFSDFPNYREVAGVSGAGIAVDPTKPERIADAIEFLVRNPAIARQMGEAGRQAVRERFNWNVEKRKLLDLYRDILAV